MKRGIIFFALFFLCWGISGTSFAGNQEIYRSVYIGGLSPDQFLSAGMPKDKCAPWVMWNTGNPEIPMLIIIHIAEHNRRPRLHVISQVNNDEVFQDLLLKIKGFWNASGISPIGRTVEGDLVAIITFPGQTIDLEGNSTMTIAKTILVNTQEHEVYLRQIDEFAKEEDIYQNATIDLWCNNLPAEVVDNSPYPNHIAAR